MKTIQISSLPLRNATQYIDTEFANEITVLEKKNS